MTDVFQAATMAKLAEQMNLDPVTTIALPTAIESSARKVGMSVPSFMAEMDANEALRSYIAGVLSTVDVQAALDAEIQAHKARQRA
jgi:hypothetical protein